MKTVSDKKAFRFWRFLSAKIALKHNNRSTYPNTSTWYKTCHPVFGCTKHLYSVNLTDCTVVFIVRLCPWSALDRLEEKSFSMERHRKHFVVTYHQQCHQCDDIETSMIFWSVKVKKFFENRFDKVSFFF